MSLDAALLLFPWTIYWFSLTVLLFINCIKKGRTFVLLYISFSLLGENQVQNFFFQYKTLISCTIQLHFTHFLQSHSLSIFPLLFPSHLCLWEKKALGCHNNTRLTVSVPSCPALLVLSQAWPRIAFFHSQFTYILFGLFIVEGTPFEAL